MASYAYHSFNDGMTLRICVSQTGRSKSGDNKNNKTLLCDAFAAANFMFVVTRPGHMAMGGD